MYVILYMSCVPRVYFLRLVPIKFFIYLKKKIVSDTSYPAKKETQCRKDVKHTLHYVFGTCSFRIILNIFYLWKDLHYGPPFIHSFVTWKMLVWHSGGIFISGYHFYYWKCGHWNFEEVQMGSCIYKKIYADMQGINLPLNLSLPMLFHVYLAGKHLCYLKLSFFI